jgi:FkbM family methyltransferase
MIRNRVFPWVKHHVKNGVLRSTSLTAPTVALLRALNRPRFAAALVQAAPKIPEVVWCVVPGQLRPTYFKLLTSGGTDFIANAVWRDGWLGFERPLPDLLAALVRRLDGVVLDVGANTGFYSLLATAVNPKVRVRAFEPFRPVYKLLQQHILENRNSRIESFELAISDSIGETQLYIPLQGHGLIETSASLNSNFKEQHSQVLIVKRTTLDQHLANNSIGAARVGLIKIDVEGHENEVLRGAQITIAKHRPAMVIEVLKILDLEVLNTFLKENGYVSYSIQDGKLFLESEVRYIERPESWNHLALPKENSRPAELEPFFA